MVRVRRADLRNYVQVVRVMTTIPALADHPLTTERPERQPIRRCCPRAPSLLRRLDPPAIAGSRSGVRATLYARPMSIPNIPGYIGDDPPPRTLGAIWEAPDGNYPPRLWPKARLEGSSPG